GQEKFHSLAPMYYRNALTAIVVFDVTKYTSFSRAQTWTSARVGTNIHHVFTEIANHVYLEQVQVSSTASSKNIMNINKQQKYGQKNRCAC
ncbi:hypothetical protein INT46_002767, partial [Mucor plumbeus]